MRIAFLAGLAALALTAGASAQHIVDLELAGFDRIEAGGGYEIIVSVGSDFSVRLEGDTGDIDRIETTTRGDLLRVVQRSRLFGNNRQLDVVVHVTLPSVEALDFHRGINANVTGIAAADLAVDVNTGATASLAGTCTNLDLDITTGGVLNAAELVCERGEVHSSTGGEARIHLTSSVEARAGTGAVVRVLGSPSQRDVRSSLGGEIRFDPRR